MADFLLFCIISSLIITAIHVSTWDGMLFGRVRCCLDGIISPFWQKPLYGCIICMASLWGTIIYSIVLSVCYFLNTYFITDYWVLMFLPYVTVVAGINALISGIIYLAFEKNTTEI